MEPLFYKSFTFSAVFCYLNSVAVSGQLELDVLEVGN